MKKYNKTLEELLQLEKAIEIIFLNRHINTAEDIDKLCSGWGGSSFNYFIDEVGKVVGFFDYSSRGVKIRIDTINMLRADNGSWLGYPLGHEERDKERGEEISIFYTKSELKKMIKTKDQLKLF
tara:strand:+ start:3244 stop:3615 length:372 start_codon:yes stop_codon:yes gene_type:complete